jgi:hypothetical protein
MQKCRVKGAKMKPSQDTTPSDAVTTPTDVVQWVQALMELHARIAPHFVRPEPRHRALAYRKAGDE